MEISCKYDLTRLSGDTTVSPDTAIPQFYCQKPVLSYKNKKYQKIYEMVGGGV